jgi:lipoprotein-anchoring transpeptidase ErfK/SrfK
VVVAIVLPLALVLALAGAIGALVVDGRAQDTLPAGAVVQGVEVGNLHFDAAVARVRQRVEAPLHRPVKVTVDSYSVQTTPWDLGYRVDVPGAIEQAMDERRSGTVLSRVSSQLFSSADDPFADARPSWGEGTLDQVVADAAKAIGAEPRDADLDISTGWVKIVPGKVGKEIDVEASKQALMYGVATGSSSVKLVVRELKPANDPTMSKVILVRAGENKLYLYENGLVVKSWPVATGAKGYLTPEGVWHITQKLVNPSWHNPGSAWAKGLPAVIGPGPNNPLGTHALRLDAPAILIHATSNKSSIGYSESHGCIRMNEADELELFNQVPVGTRVAVVQVLPPRPIGSDPIDATAF